MPNLMLVAVEALLLLLPLEEEGVLLHKSV
jgi:hypothetical protein